MKKLRTVSFGVFLVVAACMSRAKSGNGRLAFSADGSTFYDFVYLVKSDEPVNKHSMDTLMDNTWDQKIGGRLGIRASFAQQRGEMYLALRSYVWFLVQGAPQINSSMTRNVAAYIDKGYIRYSFGDVQAPAVDATFGYFNMHYAPEAKNLGEYLFRCGTYPGFVLSGPGGYDMLGLWLHSEALPRLSLDFLFTTEINVFPNFDYSPSLMAHYRLFDDALTVGAGVMFNRLISVNSQNTTPELYAIDRNVYTHRGTKLMARACFDPKPLFNAGIFGDEDLKLYFEAAWLGVENYPFFYEDPKERVPFMGGIHLPVFNILDYLAYEMEWYGSPWQNNPDNEGVPYPAFSGSQPGSADDIKWSVTASKTIPDWLNVTVRVARDHWRQENGNGYYNPGEFTTRPEHWYWALFFKTNFSTDKLEFPFARPDEE